MAKLYKLTDRNGRTYNNTQWGPGVTHTASGEGELCGPGWIHAYTDPLLAVLLNPIHADFSESLLWECEGDVSKTDGLKVGCTSLTTLRQIPLPQVTTEQRVKFAIFCVLQVCDDAEFVVWAKRWISGEDRSRTAAAWAAAAWSAEAAAAAWLAAAAAARSAAAAAAEAAWLAAAAAAKAIWAAEIVGIGIDLVALAHQACKED